MTGIRDVARLAGVAPATVARVLDSTAEVSEELAKRVTEAATELEYRPNHISVYSIGAKHDPTTLDFTTWSGGIAETGIYLGCRSRVREGWTVMID